MSPVQRREGGPGGIFLVNLPEHVGTVAETGCHAWWIWQILHV